jgi:hypothetical protein
MLAWLNCEHVFVFDLRAVLRAEALHFKTGALHLENKLSRRSSMKSLNA